MKKFLFLFFTVLIVIVSTGCSGSPAKDMANKFMQYFKEEDFYEMGNISSYGSAELILSYNGINIINYEVKSVSEGMVKHRVSVYNRNDDDYEFNKKIKKTLYPDYEVIRDDESAFILQSKTENILQSIVIMDVEYSNLQGDVKRNSVYVVVEPKKPDSEELMVTEITGFVNY